MNSTETTQVTDASNTTISHSTIYNVKLDADDLEVENCIEDTVCRFAT